MNKFINLSILGLALTSATIAFAHSGATGIVKERMEAMKSIGTEMKAVGGMLQGKLDFKALRVEKAASIIGNHAANIEKLFPKGSDHKPTRALPMVWKDKTEFDIIGKDLQKAAVKLAKKAITAQSVGDIKPEFLDVAASCKACHKKFRAPEEHN